MNKLEFNLKTALIYQAIRWSQAPLFRAEKVIRKTLFCFFFVFVLLFLIGFLSGAFSQQSNSVLLGLSVIFLTLGCVLWLKTAFLNSKLKHPKIPKNGDLAEFLSFDAALAVDKAENLSRKNKVAEASSLVLFYFVLTGNPKLNFVFSRLLIDMKELQKELKNALTSSNSKQGFHDVIVAAFKIAQKRAHERIEIGDILTGLAECDSVFQKILVEHRLRVEDVENLTWWLESLERRIRERKRWWEYRNLMKKGSLAKEWTSGYTLTLDKYSVDWTEIAKKQGFPEIIGHKESIEQVERILARNEYNNVLLVGDPGVGRKSIIQGSVEKTLLGQTLPSVNYKRVVELNLSGLLAELSDMEEVEAVLDKIFQEAIGAGNVILVINDFHNFVGVKPGPGRVDISGVMSSYLHLPQFQIVAVSSFVGLHRNIEQNPSVLNLFEKVEVAEIPEGEVMLILENLALVLEQQYKIFITYQSLREIISLTRRFMASLPFPKKALDLLDEVMIYVKRSTKDRALMPRHIAKIITEKTQVPVGEIESKEKEVLLNLEELIHQRIINQAEAVREVATSLRRARAEVTVRKGPMGTFLFLGPTGVGKTETSKALAQIYFGAESRMIRLDMSEFQDVSDIPRIIGGGGEDGLLTTAARENPFSLILLDEIEKAHPNILNLFLQVLDEGFLMDGLGRKVDFKNSIIISTSNAGYQIILESLKNKTEWSLVKQKLIDYIFEKGIFRPEFINRFDAVVVFSPLSKENLLDIAELMFRSMQKNLKEKGIDFTITLALKEKIVELGYDPTFGARAMKRVIQDKVENVLASALLSNELKRGDIVEVDSQTFKLKIKSA
ncbi:MAG: ATP-dependent Clp protease ATP-binding subunit [Candidatus Nealsonbacteria bacterium]|nr:ATP-dependent Clp protease ATP-binding subunit [Candidatus Nealsonbacteria bacterium]